MAPTQPKKDRTKLECQAGSQRNVWLVKVPKYLSEQWQKKPGEEVGRLRVVPSSAVGGTSNVVFVNTLDPILLAASSSSSSAIPTDHEFLTNPVKDQTLAVFTEDKTGVFEPELKSGKLTLEGRVVSRAECRPPKCKGYMDMKAHIFNASRPTRNVQQIEKAAVKFKPISIHAEDVARDKAKREGSKAVRADKDKVLNMIFEAFERHQYYRLVDLQRVTRQPPGYVKELLNEIARYNTQPPHKAMWELKPEYRHYKGDAEK